MMQKVVTPQFLHLYNRLSDWRNEGGIGRRLAAEAGYAGLAALGFIETAIKVAMAVVSTPVAGILSFATTFISSQKWEDLEALATAIAFHSGIGAWTCALSSLATAALFLRNLSSKPISPVNLPKFSRLALI